MYVKITIYKYHYISAIFTVIIYHYYSFNSVSVKVVSVKDRVVEMPCRWNAVSVKGRVSEKAIGETSWRSKVLLPSTLPHELVFADFSLCLLFRDFHILFMLLFNRFSKAFYSVSHVILVNKLRLLNLQYNTVAPVLTYREQFTKVVLKQIAIQIITRFILGGVLIYHFYNWLSFYVPHCPH